MKSLHQNVQKRISEGEKNYDLGWDSASLEGYMVHDFLPPKSLSFSSIASGLKLTQLTHKKLSNEDRRKLCQWNQCKVDENVSHQVFCIECSSNIKVIINCPDEAN